MDKFELQRLRDLPIEEVAERLGLRVTRHKSLCPFHDDHNASLSYHTGKNTYRCFVCGAHGGTIDLAMQLLPLSRGSQRGSFKDACHWLANENNIILDSPSRSVPGASATGFSSPQQEKSVPSFSPTRYARFFDRPFLSEAARHFLFVERHLDPRVIAWCRITSWRNRDGIDWLQTPYYDMDGKLIGIQNRYLRPSDSSAPAGSYVSSGSSAPATPAGSYVSSDSSAPAGSAGSAGLSGSAAPPRFRFPYGSRCGIYNLPVLRMLKPGEELWITEGCSDCWAMLSSGHKAIAIPSATLLKEKDLKPLETCHLELGTYFHMYPDKDAPGERLFLQLKEILPNLTHHQLPMGCKDYSDYYLTQFLKPSETLKPL